MTESTAIRRRSRRPDPALEGTTVVVTAGGTSEPIDSVRSIVNRSSGRMGIAIARQAQARGADVGDRHTNGGCALRLDLCSGRDHRGARA